MSRQLSIPITNHSDPDICTQYYVVKYKLLDAVSWDVLAPNPISSPIIIDNLQDDQDYSVSVQRFCCDNQQSEEAIATFNTSL